MKVPFHGEVLLSLCVSPRVTYIREKFGVEHRLLWDQEKGKTHNYFALCV